MIFYFIFFIESIINDIKTPEVITFMILKNKSNIANLMYFLLISNGYCIYYYKPVSFYIFLL
jgi:hypothetical protein